MSRLGRSSNGRYAYRPDFSVVVHHYQNDELQAAKARLTEKLGLDGFRAWAGALPDSVVMDDQAYLQAINARLVEVSPGACTQDSTDGEEDAQ